jgi:hypothetical protein
MNLVKFGQIWQLKKLNHLGSVKSVGSLFRVIHEQAKGSPQTTKENRLNSPQKI